MPAQSRVSSVMVSSVMEGGKTAPGMSLQALGMFVRCKRGARDLTEVRAPGSSQSYRDFDWNQFAAAF